MNETPVNKSFVKIGLTLGDPAGIGPEIIAKAWPEIVCGDLFRFYVIGHAAHLQRVVHQLRLGLEIVESSKMGGGPFPNPSTVVCLPAGEAGAREFQPGKLNAAAGQAATDYIGSAIQLAKQGSLDGIVTAPINKAAIRLAGCDFPGHTEIFADSFGVRDFAMMLFVPRWDQAPDEPIGGAMGLGVVHTTLHQSLKSAIDDLSVPNILSKCKLAHDFAADELRYHPSDRAPRIAVAALNPHAGEHGLFGREEIDIIKPAVEQAKQLGINCTGPLPCDTLMARAVGGQFDMVVAMYHDQGHIALKLMGMHKAVNVTLGLPIVRTSVAHGTAFEIAGTGKADHRSLLRAVDVAKRMCLRRRNTIQSCETPIA